MILFKYYQTESYNKQKNKDKGLKEVSQNIICFTDKNTLGKG